MADTVRVWKGGTSTNPATAANWDPATAIATGDTLIYNDEAGQLCDGGSFTAGEPGIDVFILVEESFPFTVGSSGTPLSFNGIQYMKFSGVGTGASYFATEATDFADLEMDNVVVNSPSTANPCVDLDGTIARLVNERGRTNIETGAVVSGRLQVLGAISGSPSVVTVPSGCTLTGLYIAVDGGILNLSTSAIDIRQSGGEIVLGGTAGITSRHEQSGGVFYWDAKSTIALAELSGGKFITRKNRLGRVLTASAVCGNAIMDVRIGGLNLTFTKNPVKYGDAQILRPSGLTMTGSGVSEGFPW